MNSNRIISFTYCLCLMLACALLTGNVLGGKTTATEVDVAREIGKANVEITMPANTATRSLNVIRNPSEDFVLKVTLLNGAVFAKATAAVTNPEDGDVTLSVAGGGVIQTTVVSGGDLDDGFVDFFVDILTGFGTFPTLSLDTVGWVIKDVNNVLGGGGTVSITLETRDSATNLPFDIGTETDVWLTSDFAVTAGGAQGKLVTGSKVVDVAQLRKKFTGTAPLDVEDAGGSVNVDTAHPTLIGADGTSYELVNADKIDIVIAGNLSGITTVTWSLANTQTIHVVTTTEVTAGTLTIKLDGDDGSLTAGNKSTVEFVIDGTTVLGDRTLTLTVNLRLSGGVTGPTANDRAVLGTSNITVWSLNGTVLLAGFVNGNNALFSSRIYLFNPSSLDGKVTVRVFTLPLSGASTVLGSVDLGVLPSQSGKNIRLAEDILTPLAITLPYTDDGGNLSVEVTIEAEGVEGNAQVFQVDLSSFGIYTMPAL